ncbi:MAG: hypothetical protein ACRCS8_05290 [Brevinema sp.]
MLKHSLKFLFLNLIFCTTISFAQDEFSLKNKEVPDLTKRLGMQITYWYEPSFKSGTLLALDWEFMNSKGHGVAVTFPSIRLFVFPYNSFSLSFYASLAYRFVHPKNGFFTSLSMGLGLDTSWMIVPVYNWYGDEIKDPGFNRLFVVAQWDFGYDFEIKFNKPVRLFGTFGWNGRAPTNLGINSHMFFQVGVNVKLLDLARK